MFNHFAIQLLFIYFARQIYAIHINIQHPQLNEEANFNSNFTRCRNRNCLRFSIYKNTSERRRTEYYIKSESLRFTVASDKLTVSNNTENAVFNFSDLVSMAFSENAAALTDVTAEECSGVIVYTASGIQTGHFNSMTEALNAISTSGVYVVKSQKGTLKILVIIYKATLNFFQSKDN